MRIDQYTPTLMPYDAVGNNVFALQRILKNNGYESTIYAEVIDKSLQEKALSVKKYESTEEDYLIIHMSTASQFLQNSIETIKAKKVMIYHNITPSRFFTHFDSILFEATFDAREQLLWLKNFIDFPLADSSFNADELTSNGYKNVKVLPIIYDKKNHTPEVNSELEKELKKQTNILFVGRMVPNKCQHDVIKAFYFYRKYYNPDARLYIIGGSNNVSDYRPYLHEVAEKLHLTESVIFPGKVSDNDLFTYYKNTSLYVSMSEHEGFCVPVVECMEYGVPVLAYFDSGALPETAGTGAVYFTEKKYLEVAGIMDYIINNQDLLKKMQRNQKQELLKFDPDVLEQTFLKIIKEITTNE